MCSVQQAVLLALLIGIEVVSARSPSTLSGVLKPLFERRTSTGAVDSVEFGKRRNAPECVFDQYMWHPNVSSWEIQAAPRRRKLHDRDAALEAMEELMTRFGHQHPDEFQLIPSSRWTAVFHEHMFQLTTRHGKHLDHHTNPEVKSLKYPWGGLAYLRLRNYRVLIPATAYVPGSQAGMADLTLKMKKVDPGRGVHEVEMPPTVHGAKVSGKMENDVHCDHLRVTLSPLYKPVPQDLNVSKIANVKDYFPNLAAVVQLDENRVLPFMHEVYRSKSVWAVLFKSVVGEVNLVIKYRTLQDAVAGTNPKNGEVSFRIRKQVALASDEEVHEGLEVVAKLAQYFRSKGWDEKTPSLSSKKGHWHDSDFDLDYEDEEDVTWSGTMRDSEAADDDEGEQLVGWGTGW